MREWKFHPVVAWGLGLTTGFIVFMTIALPALFGMLWAEMHPADGKVDGTILPWLALGLSSIAGCIWLAVFVARRLTRKQHR
jgi:hypothetical protein